MSKIRFKQEPETMNQKKKGGQANKDIEWSTEENGNACQTLG